MGWLRRLDSIVFILAAWVKAAGLGVRGEWLEVAGQGIGEAGTFEMGGRG